MAQVFKLFSFYTIGTHVVKINLNKYRNDELKT